MRRRKSLSKTFKLTNVEISTLSIVAQMVFNQDKFMSYKAVSELLTAEHVTKNTRDVVRLMYGHTLPTRTAFLTEKLELVEHYRKWCAQLLQNRQREEAARCSKCGRLDCNDHTSARSDRRDQHQ